MKDNIIGVTNPSFEILLLFHYEGTYEKLIKPNISKIIENKKIGKIIEMIKC